MNYENISSEIKEKALACTTAEELAALAKAEGIQLTKEELEGIAGGTSWDCGECTSDSPCSAGASRDQGKLGMM